MNQQRSLAFADRPAFGRRPPATHLTMVASRTPAGPPPPGIDANTADLRARVGRPPPLWLTRLRLRWWLMIAAAPI